MFRHGIITGEADFLLSPFLSEVSRTFLMFGIPEVESGATNSSGKGEMKCRDFNTLLVRTPIEIVSPPHC